MCEASERESQTQNILIEKKYIYLFISLKVSVGFETANKVKNLKKGRKKNRTLKVYLRRYK